ncbi:MAG: sulfotransferase [Planctomycetes bacterium]|nr:sulfotransferase [Planctomycetota bacterium]
MTGPATTPTRDFITIVSGLPRSGTSLMMQMLEAGGIEAVTDGERKADADNPRGYYEFERVKQIRTDKAWLPDAVGKQVKMVHLLLLDLPTALPSGIGGYRVVFMRRHLEEVVRSQATMLERSGKSGAALTPERLIALYRQQIDQVLAHTARQPCFRVLEVSYNDLMADPAGVAPRLDGFLGGGLPLNRMIAAVDPSLYRNRKA